MVKFNNKNVSLSHLWVSRNDRLSDFYASSWQREDSPVPLLVIRLILVLFSFGILIWSTIESNSPYWLIFLTNWGILLVTGTTLCSLIVSVVVTVKKPYETTELPWYVGFYWLMFNLAVTISIIITSLYWILLYTPGMHDEGGLRALWLDITTHGLTACIMLAELIVSRTPVRLAHIYQPLGFGLWYVAFSGIYYAAGGTDALGNTYIYSVLNWEEVGHAAIVAVASCGALIVLYLILWTLAFCRDKISLNLVRTRSHDLPILPTDHVDRRIV